MNALFDPATLEILWNRLISIAEEQAKALVAASFSTIIAEMEDMACGLYDREGNIVAQAITGTIGVLTGMTVGMKHFLREYPAETLAPGDVLISNDPWMFSGHKYDITVATPVFLHDEVVAFCASILHPIDIGGIGYSAVSKEVYDEGLHIPIMKLMEQGKLNEILLKIVRSNVRKPDLVIGDILAEISANEVGANKLIEFMEEYGLTTLAPLASTIFNKTQKAMRESIEAIPDGVYRHEVYMDGFDEPLKLAVTITIQGADLTVDYSGTSPQVDYGINSVYNFTFAYTMLALKSALAPELPNNEACFQAIKLIVPDGCLLNPSPPAPLMARHIMVSFITAAVFGALSRIIPERVIADSGCIAITSINGIDQRGNAFNYWFLTNGGMGARPTMDGLASIAYPHNIANVPVEVVENVSPVFVLSKELVQDSGGPGKYRGGCDQEVVIKVRSAQPAVLSCMYERIHHAATGKHGGMDGTAGVIVVNKEIRPHSKRRYTLMPGDELTVRHGGGGGFYPPYERVPELVLKDVIDGYISLDSARNCYKVVIDAKKKTIDQKATRTLRAASA